jgi:hypothetical protein
MFRLKRICHNALTARGFLYLLMMTLTFNPVLLQADSYKHFNLGAGKYKMVLSNNTGIDDEFTGYALFAQYAFTDNVAARISLYNTEEESYIQFDNDGGEMLALFGAGLYTEGFRIYVGAGYFSEDWQLTTLSASHNGLMLSGGIGYNWKIISVDLILGIRDVSDYQDLSDQVNPFLEIDRSTSTSILLSARF